MGVFFRHFATVGNLALNSPTGWNLASASMADRRYASPTCRRAYRNAPHGDSWAREFQPSRPCCAHDQQSRRHHADGARHRRPPCVLFP
jgi:hypothetical protein